MDGSARNFRDAFPGAKKACRPGEAERHLVRPIGADALALRASLLLPTAPQYECFPSSSAFDPRGVRSDWMGPAGTHMAPASFQLPFLQQCQSGIREF